MTSDMSVMTMPHAIMMAGMKRDGRMRLSKMLDGTSRAT